MNELERIVEEASRLWEVPYLLATVVRVEGSSYRRPGARMLFAGDRWISGCISGGCIEGDLMLRGEDRCRHGPVVVSYDSMTDEGEPWEVGLGCNGVVEVLLELNDAGSTNDALAFARACFTQGVAGVLVTVIRSNLPSAPVGSRIAVGPPVELARPVADLDLLAELQKAALGPLGVVQAGGVVALVERIAPSPELFVLGSAHDVPPLANLANSAGFRVTVADRIIRAPSRFETAVRLIATGGDGAKVAALIDTALEAYIVIMHHQRGPDRVALGMALASRARYLGVLGPARRTRELLEELGRPGDERLHAPVGLDVGAETPEQIAVAIVGELCAVARGRSGGSLRRRARELHAEVATIVLAAGGSVRLGYPKQLVEINGVPLVRLVVERCLTAAGGPVGVVIGAKADSVAQALRGLPVVLIENPRWADGMASSIRAGVTWAESGTCTALMIALCDQPYVPHAHLTALRHAWSTGAPVAATRWSEPCGEGASPGSIVVGAPAIFDRSRWSALQELEGDGGAGRFFRGRDVVAVDCALAAKDVDTPEDVRALASGASA